MYELNKENIGKAVKAFRKSKGFSQEVLSRKAGIARSHLAMIETGSKQPNFATIWQLANALEIRPSQLVAAIESYDLMK